MVDKCKKKAATLAVCDEMAMALRHGFLRRQTLTNRVTGTSRERVVLTGKAGDMPLWYCPFCRIDIAIAARTQEGAIHE